MLYGSILRAQLNKSDGAVFAICIVGFGIIYSLIRGLEKEKIYSNGIITSMYIIKYRAITNYEITQNCDDDYKLEIEYKVRAFLVKRKEYFVCDNISKNEIKKIEELIKEV